MNRTLYLLFTIFVGLNACQQQQKKKAPVDWTLYRKAYAFLNENTDSAFYYFNRAATSSNDSLQIAMAYTNMAMIQSDAGDYFGAQESLTQSLDNLNDRDPDHLACLTNNYNELGMNSSNLKLQDDAISFYEKALRLAPDSTLRDAILGNKAFALQEKGDYQSAIKIYQRLLGRKGIKESSYARRLTNLAETKWLADRHYNAIPELLKALRIRERNNDEWGMNSSYINLGRYYQASKPDSAYYYGTKMYNIASKLNSPDDRLEALDLLIKVGPPPSIKYHYSTYRKFIDSVQNKRAAAKNQFALIRYNVEKRNAENLLLQKDVAEKRYQLFLAVLLFVVVVTSLSFYFWKRRRQMRLQQDLAIKENEMRIAKKVHDGVANGIYQLMSEVEHGLLSDNEELADKLDSLYQRSRDISYEKPGITTAAFDQQLSVQLRSFGGPNCHISLIGNGPELWSRVPDSIRQNVNYVLLELMVNMKKHSRATNVLIKFDAINELQILYSDDGIGLRPDIHFGNGLKGTENRIQSMRGVLTFDRGPGKGLKIAISIPL